MTTSPVDVILVAAPAIYAWVVFRMILTESAPATATFSAPAPPAEAASIVAVLLAETVRGVLSVVGLVLSPTIRRESVI